MCSAEYGLDELILSVSVCKGRLHPPHDPRTESLLVTCKQKDCMLSGSVNNGGFRCHRLSVANGIISFQNNTRNRGKIVTFLDIKET